MTMTRRTLATTALATSLTGAAIGQTQPPARPIVIAHRGASGERPEHTRSAYELAIQQGCDFIEPDLVATKDGHLIARHENEIGGTTDVATRPDFAGRKTRKVIDGEPITGWFSEDFTLAEIKTLRCRERLPQLRPNNAMFDGRDEILTFAEVAAIARSGSQHVGRTIGVYPEMKHPTYFASVGLPLEDRLLAALRLEGLDSESASVFIQCFEVGALKAIRGKTKVRLIQLMSLDGGPADQPTLTYAQMSSASGLRTVATYADGIGPDKAMVVTLEGGSKHRPTALVGDAHAAGLKVHPWTVRAENTFLPSDLQRGDRASAEFGRLHGDALALLKALYAARVDGLFCDFPALAVQARS